MPDMPEMPIAVGSKEKTTGSNDSGEARPAEGLNESATTSTGNSAAKPAVPAPAGRAEPRPDLALIRTVEQFVTALNDPNGRGGLLRVAADADWVLPQIHIRATGSWRVQAEAGPTRPKLRFDSAQAEPNAASGWLAMLDLRAGSLQLEGFDVVLPRSTAAKKGRPAAFLVRPTTDLSLSACTVTIEGEQPGSAVVAAA
jgi:hypothetical protein